MVKKSLYFVLVLMAGLLLGQYGKQIVYAATGYLASGVNFDSASTAASVAYRDGNNSTSFNTLVNDGGSLVISSNTSAGAFRIKFLGALTTKPASSTEGDVFWDRAQHTLVIATATDAGNGSWLKANIGNIGGTQQAPWTLY